MKKLIAYLAFVFMVAAVPVTAADSIKVFACEPEWASLVNELGGEYVQTYAATNAQQDPHHIRARPSLLAKMRGSELVLCSGADLEVGWLPLLLQKSGGKGVQPGAEFSLMAADLVPVLEKPQVIDRSMGDVHPDGNPHVHLNPHNIILVAKVVHDRLKRLRPEYAAQFQQQYQQFVTRWTKAIADWENTAQSLKGQSVFAHHKSWSYLIDWLGLNLINTLEPKPGLPPTAGQLEKLFVEARTKQAFAILRTPYDPSAPSQWLGAKANITQLQLPYTIGGRDNITDLFLLFDETLAELLAASKNIDRAKVSHDE